MTKNAKWSAAVQERDCGWCMAIRHDPRCRLYGQHAHHIVYRSQCPSFAHWILANGVWLSTYCHNVAHRAHNANITAERKRAAVDAVNAEISRIAPHKPELRVRHFEEAA